MSIRIEEVPGYAYTVACANGVDHATAHDLSQDVALEALESPPDALTKAWVAIRVRSRCVDRLRSFNHRSMVPVGIPQERTGSEGGVGGELWEGSGAFLLSYPDTQPLPGEEVTEEIELPALRDLVTLSLTPRERVLVRLYCNGYTTAEAARHLAVSPSKLYPLLFRLIARLKRRAALRNKTNGVRSTGATKSRKGEAGA